MRVSLLLLVLAKAFLTFVRAIDDTPSLKSADNFDESHQALDPYNLRTDVTDFGGLHTEIALQEVDYEDCEDQDYCEESCEECCDTQDECYDHEECYCDCDHCDSDCDDEQSCEEEDHCDYDNEDTSDDCCEDECDDTCDKDNTCDYDCDCECDEDKREK